MSIRGRGRAGGLFGAREGWRWGTGMLTRGVEKLNGQTLVKKLKKN
jgi:hypothetical protein